MMWPGSEFTTRLTAIRGLRGWRTLSDSKPPTPQLKRILRLLLVAFAVGAGIWGYLLTQGQGTAPAYRLEKAERGRLVAAVSAAGNLNAVTTVQVGTQVSGQIKELHADFNSVVRKGQLIARIDPATFEAKVKQARADVEAANHTVLTQKANIERARADVRNARAALAEGKAQTARAQVVLADTKRDLARRRELFDRALISKSEHDTAQVAHDAAVTLLDAAHAKEESLAGGIDSAQAQLRVAEAMLQASRAQVDQKNAALQQMQLDLEHTTILAPVDGVVVSRAVDVGQTVAASLAAPTLFTIARDLTKMQVEANVDEADIGRIRVDGSARFTVDAFPGDTFAGRIVQVRKAAQVVQSVVTYVVIIAVDNPEGKLLPGMTANVKLIVGEKSNVLKVPNTALRFRPPGAPKEKTKDKTKDTAKEIATDPATDTSEDKTKDTAKDALTDTGKDTPTDPAADTPKTKIKDKTKDKSKDTAEATSTDSATDAPQTKTKDKTKDKSEDTAEATSTDSATDVPKTKDKHKAERTAQRGDASVPGRVWVIGPDGELRAVALRLGLTDGTATEVRGGEIKEGQEVVVGFAGGSGGKHAGSKDRSPRLQR